MPEALERFMRIGQKELLIEVNLLEEAGLVEITRGSVEERDVNYLVITDEMLNNLFFWMQKEKISIRTALNTMDFSIIDG